MKTITLKDRETGKVKTFMAADQDEMNWKRIRFLIYSWWRRRKWK